MNSTIGKERERKKRKLENKINNEFIYYELDENENDLYEEVITGSDDNDNTTTKKQEYDVQNNVTKGKIDDENCDYSEDGNEENIIAEENIKLNEALIEEESLDEETEYYEQSEYDEESGYEEKGGVINEKISYDYYNLSKETMDYNNYEKLLNIKFNNEFIPLSEIDDKELNEPIYEGGSLSLKYFYYLLYCIKQTLNPSDELLSIFLKLMSLVFPVSEHFPKTLKKIWKNLTIFKRVSKIPICGKCEKHIFAKELEKNFENESGIIPTCPCCHSEGFRIKKEKNGKYRLIPKNVIHFLPISSLIKDYLKFDSLFKEECLNTFKNIKWDIIDDWIQSKYGKRFYDEFKSLSAESKLIFIIFTLSYDGVSLHKSGIKKTVYPVSLIIMNLNKTLRGKPFYIFLQILYASRNGKILNGNLLAFLCVQELKIMMRNEISNIDSGFLIRLLQITGDNPGLKEFLGIGEKSGKFQCNKCIGGSEPRKTKFISKKSHKIKEVTTYKYFNIGNLRTVESIKVALERRKECQEVVDGVKFLSCFNLLPEFDLIDQTKIDELHTIQCIVKKLISKYPPKLKSKLDKFVDVVVYHNFGRKFREISHSSSWKAEEYFKYILFFSRPFLRLCDAGDDLIVLHDILGEILLSLQYIKNNENDLKTLKNKLNIFRVLFYKFLGEDYFPITSHQFSYHIIECIRNTGNFHEGSCWLFESFYRYIRSFTTGKKEVVDSILRGICCIYNSHLITSSLKKKELPDDILEFLLMLGQNVRSDLFENPVKSGILKIENFEFFLDQKEEIDPSKFYEEYKHKFIKMFYDYKNVSITELKVDNFKKVSAFKRCFLESINETIHTVDYNRTIRKSHYIEFYLYHRTSEKLQIYLYVGIIKRFINTEYNIGNNSLNIPVAEVSFYPKIGYFRYTDIRIVSSNVEEESILVPLQFIQRKVFIYDVKESEKVFEISNIRGSVFTKLDPRKRNILKKNEEITLISAPFSIIMM